MFTPVASGQTGSSTAAPCILGYTVGFFNGVWNTHRQAVEGLYAITAAVNDATGTSTGVFNKEDIAYELFYNQTGSATGTGNTGLQDLAEVFIQRMDALDSTGNLATDAMFMFWDAANGITAFHQPLSQANPDFDQLFTQFGNDVVATALGAISALLSSPPTAADYAAQEMQLTADANNGRKLLLVAHSQGNLFVNHGYDFIEPSITMNRVKAVHIAPASPTLRGAWTLSTNDLIINGLRAFGGANSVPMNTVTIPSSSTDASGHTLIGTYLTAEAGRSQGRTAIETQLLNALTNLASSPTCNATIAPATSVIQPGKMVTLTATVAPPIADTTLTTFYSWTVSGNAGGVLTGSSFGSTGTTYISSTPSVTYTASPGASQGSTDTVKVGILVATNPNDMTTAKQIGSGMATLNSQGSGGQGFISNGQLVTGTITGGSPPHSTAATYSFTTSSTAVACASLDYAFPYKFGLSLSIDNDNGGVTDCVNLAPGNHTISIPGITYGLPTDMMTYTLKLVVDDASSGGVTPIVNGVTYHGQAVGPHYDVLSFSGSAGDAVVLTMINSGNTGVEFPFPFRNHLQVFSPDHEQLYPIGGGPQDLLKLPLNYVLPTTGTYVIFAGDDLPLIDIVTGYTLTISGLSGSSQSHVTWVPPFLPGSVH